MDANRHAGRVALVSGAGRGIGRATVLRLAQEGATVFGFDLDESSLAESKAEATALQCDIHAIVGDVTSQADIDRVVGHVESSAGRLDILANVAGINDHFQPLHSVEDSMWEKVIGVNLHGPMMLSRRALAPMRAQGFGVIVNVGSVAALGGGVAGVSYTASKHALLGLTRSVAWAYRTTGIRCNAVCPGGVVTEIGVDGLDGWGFEVLKPSHRLAGPLVDAYKIAASISWLSCDEASNITGAVLTNDGGWSTA